MGSNKALQGHADPWLLKDCLGDSPCLYLTGVRRGLTENVSVHAKQWLMQDWLGDSPCLYLNRVRRRDLAEAALDSTGLYRNGVRRRGMAALDLLFLAVDPMGSNKALQGHALEHAEPWLMKYWLCDSPCLYLNGVRRGLTEHVSEHSKQW